jgi:Ca-activated chloride channel family protein
MKVDVDEPTLQKIADITGAKMFRATDSNSLQNIYDAINTLETTTRKLKKYEDYEELYLYALLPALTLFLITKILGQTLLRTLP